MTNTVIRIESLYKEYLTDAGTVPVLMGVDIEVLPGEFVAVMGPSGSGKSTFMNILGCLDVASSGSYLLNGQDVNNLTGDELAKLRNEVIGFVFQGFNLLPRANLEDNVALPLIYRGIPRAERLLQSRNMLEKVGLGKLCLSRPNQISGGQQQRVAIARALINQPRLLLADEPTGNLDETTADTVFALLCELVAETGAGLILVTHSERLAARLGRRMRLRAGQVSDGKSMLGTICAAGSVVFGSAMYVV